MSVCEICEKEFLQITPIVDKGTNYCQVELEEDFSGKVICSSCLIDATDEPNEALYGQCGLDSEKTYALHVSDLTFYHDNFYCKEHIGEVRLTDDERDGWESYVDYLNKDG